MVTAVAMAAEAREQCLSRPDSAISGEWKYKITESGQKCWHLVSDYDVHAREQKVYRVFHHRWTGPYAGLNVGYGWSSFSFGGDRRLELAGVAISPPVVMSTASLLGGGQVGYRYRVGKWVLGVEDQFDYLNFTMVDWTAGVAGKVRWTNDLDATVGYVWSPSIMTFVGAGYTTGQRSDFSLFSDAVGSSNLEGFNVRAGAQYAITDHIATGITYELQEFGSGTYIQAVKWNLDFTWIEVNGVSAPEY